jgi:Cu(I)/Ag(I) efflux system membrane fusion protein
MKSIEPDRNGGEILNFRPRLAKALARAIPSLGKEEEGVSRTLIPALNATQSENTWRINPSLPSRGRESHQPRYERNFYQFLGAVSFIALLLVCACSNPKKATQTARITDSVKYTCSMHHQILEDHPGSCPICGMTLVKVTGQASEGAGISLNTVLQPVNSSVISDIKAITPEEKEIPTQITGQGYLDFDSRTFNNIAARFSGRIEKLYIKYAFQEIYRGQRIFDIYSPDMVSAQQDFIYVSKNSPTETGLISAARQKLLLLGMTDGQLKQVVATGRPFYSLPVYSPYDGHVHDAPHSQMSGPPDAKPEQNFAGNMPLSVKEGMYVEKGQTIFNVVDPHRLWAIIKIDGSAISVLKLNQPVEISFPDIPGKTLAGKVNFIEPALQAGDKTTAIRVYLDNMDHGLEVNSVIKATIQTGTTKGLWIPRAALLDLGKTKIVWLKTGPLYRAHEVSTGVIDGNEIEIRSWLSATDSLASNAQYLTDSESFIKTKGDEKQY